MTRTIAGGFRNGEFLRITFGEFRGTIVRVEGRYCYDDEIVLARECDGVWRHFVRESSANVARMTERVERTG